MSDERFETATLGGGCFWCLEAVYERLRGVKQVTSGYAGGSEPDPTYHQVSSGETGHAEVVQIEFDPQEITFQELLDVFFTIHDPTTLNRQGADVGPQYRSIILYHSDEQKAIAEETIRRLEDEKVWADPIVTQLEPAAKFYTAEAYHHGYYRRNPAQAYCQVVIAPKVSKLRQQHMDKLAR